MRLVYTEHPKTGTEFLSRFLSDSAFNLLENFCATFLVDSRNGRLSRLAVPRLFLLCFSCSCYQFLFVSQYCHLLKRKFSAVVKSKSFLFSEHTRKYTKIELSKIIASTTSDSQLNNRMITRFLNFSTFVSPIYTFSLVVNVSVCTPNQSKQEGKVLYSYLLRSKNADSDGK